MGMYVAAFDGRWRRSGGCEVVDLRSVLPEASEEGSRICRWMNDVGYRSN